MPNGDATKGREAFEKFACYVCHEVRGEKFPAAAPGSALGPELSQMGPLHPLEFFSESVINPGAYAAKKYRGPDGKSTMPSYNDRMTVQELIDLSSYIASLKPKGVAKSATGEGTIIALVPESQEIVIDHEEIKGFMDAMTMGYKVTPTSLSRASSPGIKFVSPSTPTSAPSRRLRSSKTDLTERKHVDEIQVSNSFCFVTVGGMCCLSVRAAKCQSSGLSGRGDCT